MDQWDKNERLMTWAILLITICAGLLCLLMPIILVMSAYKMWISF